MTYDGKTRILLVDDHEPTRKEVARFLGNDESLDVVAEAASGEEGVSMSKRVKPDLVVMDLVMPGISGIEATKRIVAADPGIKVLSLSNYTGRIMIEEVRRAGARGYVRKAEAFEELIPAIHSVEEGENYFEVADS